MTRRVRSSFWKALREVYGMAREQGSIIYVRRAHKTAHVFNKLPKGVQPRARQHLRAIWKAETKEVAKKAFAS